MADSPAKDPVRSLLERKSHLLSIHSSLRTLHLDTLHQERNWSSSSRLAIPTLHPPAIPRSRRPRNRLHDLVMHIAFLSLLLCREIGKYFARNTLPNPQRTRLLQLDLQPLLDNKRLLEPSCQSRVPHTDSLDHIRDLPAELHSLHDHGHHTLHTVCLAGESPAHLHTFGILGAVLGMVLRNRIARRRYGAQHVF